MFTNLNQINELYPEASWMEISQMETFRRVAMFYDRSARAGAGPVTEGTTVPLSLYTYHGVDHSGKVNRIGQGFRESERTYLHQ